MPTPAGKFPEASVESIALAHAMITAALTQDWGAWDALVAATDNLPEVAMALAVEAAAAFDLVGDARRVDPVELWKATTAAWHRAVDPPPLDTGG